MLIKPIVIGATLLNILSLVTATEQPSATVNPTESLSPSYSSSPSYSPTNSFSPTSSLEPTTVPSPSPSDNPTSSHNPTTSPTSRPTDNPTSPPTDNPSANPSPRPTRRKSEDFFNYNPYTKWGPQHWSKIPVKDSEYYEILSDSDDENECDGRAQSPRNIKKQAGCRDDHQSNGRRGGDDFDTIEFSLQPHALRAAFKDPHDEDGPMMDWSNLTPSKVPAIFAEVKLPAEHLWNGKRYDGEFQITHHWDKDSGRFIILSMLMDATENIHNRYLEEFIRAWEEKAWKRTLDCNRALNDSTLPPYTPVYPIRTSDYMRQLWGRPGGDGSSGDANWDLYKMITTVWYCGYEGSLTVPPCVESTRWRILDIPMKISTSQLERMKTVFMGYLNRYCRTNNVAWKERVARPIQMSYERIYCCDEDDWDPRFERQWRGKFPSGYKGYQW